MPVATPTQRQEAPSAAASRNPRRVEPIDPTALPSVQPEPCAAVGGGKRRRVLSVSERKPLLEAARGVWDADWMAPIGCVEQVSVSCAPDLDGNPGPEVVAEIRYLAGTEECGIARRRGVSSTHALLALAPPTPDSSAWLSLGLIGYGRFDIGGVESPATTEITGFVRLPDERTALRVTRANDGADCAGQRTVDILAASDGALTNIATKELRGCNAP